MKIDELLKRVEYFEKLAVNGDRKTLLKRFAQEASYQIGPPAPNSSIDPNPPAPSGTTTIPEVTVVGNPRIDPKIQDMLNELLAIQRMEIFPLKPDGVLGPETKKALDKFKQIFGKPASREAIAAVYNESKNQGVAKTNTNPDGTVSPMGPGLGGIGNTKSTAPTSAGTERKVQVPKV